MRKPCKLRDGRENRRGEHAFYVDASHDYALRSVVILTHVRNDVWALIDKDGHRFTACENDIFTRQELKDYEVEDADIPQPVSTAVKRAGEDR